MDLFHSSLRLPILTTALSNVVSLVLLSSGRCVSDDRVQDPRDVREDLGAADRQPGLAGPGSEGDDSVDLGLACADGAGEGPGVTAAGGAGHGRGAHDAGRDQVLGVGPPALQVGDGAG